VPADTPITPALPDIATPDQHDRRATAWHLLLILVLGMLALGQLGWLQREQLRQFPLGEAVLEQWCGATGCSLTPSAGQRVFQIVSRELQSVDAAQPLLRLRLAAVNNSGQASALPQLRLSFTNDRGQPIALRTFNPVEYLPAADTDTPIAAGATIQAELLLRDPGPEAIGFQIELH
jgi:hypothetical protein